MNIRELLEKRANLIQQARQLLEAAEAEDRDLTQEEQQQWDRLMDDANQIRARVDREERQRAMEAELEGMHIPGEPNLPEPQARGNGSGDPRETEEYRAAFARFLRGGLRSLSGEEVRALQADVDASGGYLQAPLQLVRDLIKAVDDQVFIRQLATVQQVTAAESLGVPTLEADPADAVWTSELATGDEDTAMAFGRRELKPIPLAKRIKVSRKLLRLTPEVEALVAARLAYKFAITWEKAGMTGGGANEPLGVFVASTHGISTARDVSDGNTTTSIQFDGLISAKYALKSQYWPRARWIFHRDGVKQVAKLKDSNGQYLWRESVRVGEPDRVLGFPVAMSEYAPNTFTTGQYVGILGDFSFYWIADSLQFEIQRLDELYAATNQVGFIGRLESDGMPVLEEAFVRVQLA